MHFFLFCSQYSPNHRMNKKTPSFINYHLGSLQSFDIYFSSWVAYITVFSKVALIIHNNIIKRLCNNTLHCPNGHWFTLFQNTHTQKAIFKSLLTLKAWSFSWIRAGCEHSHSGWALRHCNSFKRIGLSHIE